MAGPVCAAAVILPDGFDLSLLDDSKRLTEARRERAMLAIYREVPYWGVGWASAAEIDEINILRASLLAMRRAFETMIAKMESVDGAGVEAIIDGLYVPDIGVPARALPKADATFPSVMAASILAKTARDRMMERYDWLYPEYGYARHKGYPTAAHLEAIRAHGPSPIQRESFHARALEQPSLF